MNSDDAPEGFLLFLEGLSVPDLVCLRHACKLSDDTASVGQIDKILKMKVKNESE